MWCIHKWEKRIFLLFSDTLRIVKCCSCHLFWKWLLINLGSFLVWIVIIYWICWFLNWQDDLLFTLFSFHFARITVANQTAVSSLLIRYRQSLLVRSCHSVAQASCHSRGLCTFNFFKFERFTGFYHFLSDTENWKNYTSTSQSSWFFCLNHSGLFQPFQGLFPQLCASPLFLLKEPELHSSRCS